MPTKLFIDISGFQVKFYIINVELLRLYKMMVWALNYSCWNDYLWRKFPELTTKNIEYDKLCVAGKSDIPEMAYFLKREFLELKKEHTIS